MSTDVKHDRIDSNTNFENSIGWGVDVKNRIIRLSEEIEAGMFDLVDAGLTELESSSKKSITVRISSYGGGCYEALAIIGRLERSKCRIITEGYGPVMSSALVILASGDERRLSRRAWVMHHEPSYGIEGKHNDMKHTVKQMEREEIERCKLMEEFTGVKASFWMNAGKNLDKYFSSEECLKLNIVDKLF